VLSLTSTESTRLNGAEPTALSKEISNVERDILQVVKTVLVPDWLRPKLISEFKIDESQVHAFPMEGRMPNEWEEPLDFGKVKQEIGFGPLDRMVAFIGPLEHAAGLDILVEALPTVLQRTPNLRVAAIGAGSMHGHLQHRANQLRVGHALRLLGHIEGPKLRNILRSSEALVLPSRGRVGHDDAVVHLARLAGKAVVTTHSGPAWLVKHEDNGVITYDNPGSMVWAMDRILSDGHNTARMGSNGRQNSGGACSWSDVAQRYLDLCSNRFSELTVRQD
jgi:glycosyltransferase involved in cell wall biosynthesis